MIINLLFTILISVVASFIGGIIGIKSRGNNNKITSFAMAFASGTMLGLIFLELIPESLEGMKNEIKYGQFISVGIIFVSVIIFFIFHELLNNHGHHKHHCETETDEDNCHEVVHVIDSIEHKNGVFMSGIAFVLAMCIHNLPEGMSIGATFASSTKSGITLASVIGIHNIIVGISISVVLIGTGISKKKVLYFTTMSSLTTILGSFLGYYLGDMNEVMLSIFLAISSGTLLFVVFYEMLPKAFKYNKSKMLFIFIVLGILVFEIINIL